MSLPVKINWQFPDALCCLCGKPVRQNEAVVARVLDETRTPHVEIDVGWAHETCTSEID